MVYTKDDALELRQELTGLVPFVQVQFNDLGGAHNAGILILLCFDEPGTWKNGILENSRYARFSVHSRENKLGMFVRSGCEKFRKTSVKNIAEIAEKLTVWANKCK